MTDVRVPVSVVAATIDMLHEHLDHLGVQVRATVPAGWTIQDGPVLTVESDGMNGRDWPVATTQTVRITTYGADQSVLLLALGACLGVPIAGVARAHPGTWPIEATDSTTRALLHSATVILTVRTAQKGL